MSWRDLSHDDVRAYYQAALTALRFAEAEKPTGRRFGPDADARWSAYKGDLTAADRLDLLIRDADAQWPAAFGARTVFAGAGIAEDEPFGPGWPGLDPVDAEEIWRAAGRSDPPAALAETLEAAAAAWGLSLFAFDPGPIAAADQIVLAGPSAIAAAVKVFADNKDLDFADQVVVRATPPAHRQLAALSSALLGTTKPLTIITGPPKDDRRPILSDDAAPEDR